MNFTILNINIKNLSFDCGWYKGENFKILDLEIFHIMDDTWTILFCFQMFKFQIYVSYNKD